MTGSVILKVLKPFRVTHLVVCLHGYVQVFKNPNSPGDGFRSYSSTIALGKGKKSASYFGNGFASLFEDEYFERGTVSYMLTSTLTRPTTISPTTSCDTKVYLIETIDIAPIHDPKPRTITLEAVSRGGRKKRSVKTVTSTFKSPQKSSDSSEPARNSRVSELGSVAGESDTPDSPSPSDISFDSQLSSGAGTEYGVRSVATADSATVVGSKISLRGKSITARIEISKGGFLRGDNIPVKISVEHTKHIKSVRGIIVTLYRQARVDMHPALPVAPHSKGDKTKSEDYYPKSRTGLGGLSLSSAGSSHLFRKDLSQSYAPLYVDPKTLTAEVKCSVRVPDDAFPTISSVPGAMISFRYYVEVVVDLQGKLTGLDKYFSNSGLLSVPNLYGTTPEMGRAEDANGSVFAAWGGNFIDTESIRRDKSVVCSVFEVVIGTKDSDRNGKKRQQPPPEPEPSVAQDPSHNTQDIPLAPGDPRYYPSLEEQEYYGYEHQDHYYGNHTEGDGYQEGDYHDDQYHYNEYDDTLRPSHFHPPNHVPEEDLPEKERLRRAEARLLPSQPPEAPGTSAQASHTIPPSAPVIPDDDAPYHPSPQHQHCEDDDTRTIPGRSNLSSTPIPSTPSTVIAAPQSHSQAVPSYSPPSNPTHRPHPEDKQELQRRRLQMERSNPNDVPDDVGEASRPAQPVIAPSAPVLDEEDLGQQGGQSDLPRYER
ncbi:uncharacterized protein BDZ99DRAFT_498161 [Mytilinidion resinicola]|uniref:Arrestin C-terminal-like domain-containing protein n=1 Tax=Mytilinidion resinicola TaxID=574789 RepID=A0A6A6YMB0_9PEZI|nr:uncharacterized protein BDZ99DRAFT_498161 [Mytilinidion resinicola]KAF2809930.1 hypothetical protein BDZ99DRAFT_498161 [Mytilinidion resinicola]